MLFIEILKSILFGIVEGVTEWLPVSSTAHLILLKDMLPLEVSATEEAAGAFFEMFKVVIQLGAIMAVVVLFFHKLNPFSPKKGEIEKKCTWNLWAKVVVGVLPSAVLGLLFDDLLEDYLFVIPVGGVKLETILIAITLILYGIAFIVVEQMNKRLQPRVRDVNAIDYRTALLIGAFQCLALVPGTSRSGATILGAIMLGVSRAAASEFSFFLAIPTMLGASALKLVKYLVDTIPTVQELVVLLTGCLISFGVSLVAIKGLMEFVRKHSFSAFGIYRIALGVIIIGYILIKTFTM